MSYQGTHSGIVTINGHELSTEIDYEFEKEWPGSRLESGSAAYVTIHRVKIKDGKEWYRIFLPAVVISDLENEILEENSL